VSGKSEAEIEADWVARRAAIHAAKAPTLPVVLKAIESTVRDLMRLADATVAGTVPLTDYLHESEPGEADPLLALLLNR